MSLTYQHERFNQLQNRQVRKIMKKVQRCLTCNRENIH